MVVPLEGEGGGSACLIESPGSRTTQPALARHTRNAENVARCVSFVYVPFVYLYLLLSEAIGIRKMAHDICVLLFGAMR
eukprot:2448852-Rhodomonas_salina.3